MANLNRPYIICHMMSTIDGKITGGDDGVDILDNYYDQYTKTEDTFEGHAWMCGRVTMQMFASTNISTLPAPINISYNDYIASHTETGYIFGVDTKGLLRWDNNTIKLESIKNNLHLIIVVTTTTPKEYLQYLQNKHISYLVAGDDKIDFLTLFKKIKEKFCVEKLLLEGGGLLNGSVLAADCVDEISLLICPLTLNRTKAPCIFERNMEEKIQTKEYMLLAVQKIENNCVWLTYKRLTT